MLDLLGLFCAESKQELDGAVVFAAFQNVEDVGNVGLLHRRRHNVAEDLCRRRHR